MDTKTVEERSANMAAIRGRDTEPELFLRKILFSKGYRYRCNKKGLPGKPDIWMKKYNTAVFVNGCFWHRHSGCRYAYMPKSNSDFWNRKFQKNIERDHRNQELLKSMHIRCLIIWECTLRKMISSSDKREEITAEIIGFLHNGKDFLEL